MNSDPANSSINASLGASFSSGNRRQGSMLIMVLVVMVILFVGAALAVDVSYMHSTRAELRTATDAASRAGAEALGRTQNREVAIQAAIDTAAANLVAGRPLILERGDIELGTSGRTGNARFSFEPGGANPDSVRVLGRRDAGSASGPVPLFFAPLFGVTEFNPVMGAASSTTTRDIALVLDVSGSMNARSGTSTRLEALIDAVNVFIDEIQETSPNSQMSLSVYSTNSRQLIELTPDLESVRATVNDLTAAGATAIGQGLLTGSASLVEDANVRPFATKTIVVMTDGNHNRDVGPEVAVQTAVNRSQTVHTITFSRGANQVLMRQVAQLGNGIHVHADDNSGLVDAFQEIARTIAVVTIE